MKNNSVPKPSPKPPARGSTSANKSGEHARAESSAEGGGVEGEGSYTGTRRYNEHLKEHLENHDVEAEAEEARAALEGDEGEELRAAEARGKAGPTQGSGAPVQRENVPPRPSRGDQKRQSR